jgi:NAD-dependent dihydropyrimidine dehydrogenase PreA subunit
LKGKLLFKALLEVYDILLAPVALGYYLVGRFLFAKTLYASSDCTGCDLCIKTCPVKAIIKVDKRPFWTFKCESCMKCMSNCPEKAIETGHGYIFAFILIFNTLIIVLVLKGINTYLLPVESRLLAFIIESVLFIAFLGAWYRIIHWLIRFKIFERVTVFTSLTRYKWWGRRYKALKPF